MSTLRPYQEQCVGNVLEQLRANRSTLYVMPTGTGKTQVFAHLANRASKRVMVLAHRQELISQAARNIERVTGQKCDIEMGENWASDGWYKSKFVVSSIQTQISGARGAPRMSRFDPNDFSLVVTDEAHHAPADSYKRVIEYYCQNQALKVVGCTATPDRTDEEALGQIFDTVAFDYELVDAIQDGWLVPIYQREVFVASLDFSKIRTTAGDLNGAELAAVLETEEHLHAIADPIFELSKGRRTLIFCVRVEHAKRLAEILNRHEENCALSVDGGTPDEERKEIFAKFHDGAARFLCNVGVATEGWDEPLCEVIAMARPTKSRALYAQMVGRATRPLAGLVDGEGAETPELRKARIAGSAKRFAEVVDFVGNSGKHQLITTADILGGKFSDEAVALVKRQANAAGEEISADVIEHLRAAEAELERERVAALDAQRRKLIVGKASYTTNLSNPFEVYGIAPARSRGWDNVKKVTDKQTTVLASNGIDTKGLTYSQVSQLIGEIFQRREKNLCSFKQARLLKKYGQRTDMSFAEAKQAIDVIAKNGWKAPSP